MKFKYYDVSPSKVRRSERARCHKVFILIPIIMSFLMICVYIVAYNFFSPDLSFDDPVDFYDEDIDNEIARHKQDSHIVLKSPRSNKWNRPFRQPSKVLLDLNNFSYLHQPKNPKTICTHPDGHKLLLLLIVSPRSNFETRDIIRHTYGSVRRFRKWIVRTVFIVGGISKDQKELSQLHSESSKYNDTIVANLSENSRETYYIHLMGYKWVVENCASNGVDFVIKAMDKTFIDMFQVVEVISTHHALPYTLMCKGVIGMKVNQSAVSKEDYPEEYYERHCSPEAIIMSYDLFKTFYEVAIKSTQRFWMENIWLTGRIRKRLGVKLIDIGYKFKERFTKMEIDWLMEDGFGKEEKLQWIFFSLPKFNLIKEEVQNLWNKTLSVHAQVYKFELNKLFR